MACASDVATFAQLNNTKMESDMKINEQTLKTGKGKLRNVIRTALVGTILVSGMANAVLRDHGPVSSTDFFPDWYRETADAGGMALAQCIFPDDGGNGPLCLTSTADATPGRFAGNIGPEAFYAAADIEVPINGGSMSWIGHLEMAYLTADGEPPAVHLANDPQEVVFSRERIRIDLQTQGGACTGTYTIRTPFSVRDYEMEEGARALFFTDDKTAIPGDFTAALAGHTGPFLKWNVGQDGLSPVSVTNPAVTINPVGGGAPRKYIGDPNTPHLFTGSTIPAGPGHEELGFNNYVEITPPLGCDLIGDGSIGTPVFEELAAISGRIWDLPIQDPVAVTKATYVRNNATAAVDVWAEANKAQNMVLTASSDASQHLPSVTMQEEEIGGNPTGRYHAHLEFDPLQTIPASVTVTNLTSNPASRASSGIVDAVVITKSTFNPVTKTLCIAAHSGDENGATLPLNLQAPSYGAFSAPTENCPGMVSNDMVLEKDLTTFGGDFRIPPEGILVQSNSGGSETSHPISLTGNSDAALLVGAVSDDFDNVPGTGATLLDLVSASYGADPDLEKTTASIDTTPANFRIVVISQPEVGTITAPAAGGIVTFTAVEGMEAISQNFYYAIQNTTDNTVTNVARVDLSVDKVIPPPVGVADNFVVFRTGGARTVNVLRNDVTGLSNTAIDPASVLLVAGAGQTLSGDAKSLTTVRGTVSVNANGTLVYTPVGQTITVNNVVESFSYTVANTANSRSVPIQTNIVFRTALETPTFNRVRFQGGVWSIRFTTTYAGINVGAPVGTTAPSGTCRLTRNNNVNGEFGQIGVTTNWTQAAGFIVIGNPGPAATGNWQVTCTTSNGNSFVSGPV